MAEWRCLVCGYIYDEEKGDPDSGIPPGTMFEDLPDEWVCPVCGAEDPIRENGVSFLEKRCKVEDKLRFLLIP